MSVRVYLEENQKTGGDQKIEKRHPAPNKQGKKIRDDLRVRMREEVL